MRVLLAVALLAGVLALAVSRWRPVADPPASTRNVVAVAPREDMLGALSMVIRDGRGGAMADAYSIHIENVENLATLVHEEVFGDDGSPRLQSLPEGRYRVIVHGEARLEERHGTVLTWATRGRSEHVVDVRRAKTTDLVVDLPAGARVRISLSGTAGPEDLQAVRTRYRTSTKLRGDLDGLAAHATIALVRPGRPPIAVQVRHDADWGVSLGDWVDLGSEATSELLPSGAFELVARLPGGREARAHVELVDGGTTAVSLAFDAPK